MYVNFSKFLCCTLIIFCALCAGYAGVTASDTLVICQGESIQLRTTPAQLSYSWSPPADISNGSVYNPSVSPLQSTTYYVTVEPVPDVNLVTNGDFSAGNTGFTSDYMLTTVATYAQGFYAIFTSPKQFNEGFGDCDDHSPTADERMFVADGATTPDERVWCQNIDVEPGRTYDFSAWITNIHPTAPSLLQFSINGEALGDLLEVNEALCVWEEFSKEWYSAANTTAEICITNQNTIAFGNDFAIDDISFILAEEFYVDTFQVVVLEPALRQIDTAICANESLLFDGVDILAGNDQVFQYVAANGCDSLVDLQVAAIDTSYAERRIDTLCVGDTLRFDGWTITRDTAICETYTNALGCDSTRCFVAYFLSETTIAVEAQTPTCAGNSDGTLEAVPFAGHPPYEFLWADGPTTAMIEQVSAGSYSVQVTDARGCVATKDIVLEEPPPLSLSWQTDEPSCFGTNDGRIRMFASGGTPAFRFTLGEGPSQTDPIFANLQAGTYRIHLTDALNCLLDTTVTLDEPNPILLSLPPDTELALGCPIEIEAVIQADFPYQVQWSPTTYLDCSDCTHPLAVPLEDITYRLRVLDERGCAVVDSLQIRVRKDYRVYLPNAFSPNRDGVNDTFRPYTAKDTERVILWQIFDRWGGLVYQVADVPPNAAELQWNGQLAGQDTAVGVYVYVLRMRFVDGIERDYVGEVVLLR